MHAGSLPYPLEEEVHVALFRPGAEVVGRAFTVDVARYGRCARVEIFSVGGQGFCALEVDEIRPQRTSIVVCACRGGCLSPGAIGTKSSIRRPSSSLNGAG